MSFNNYVQQVATILVATGRIAAATLRLTLNMLHNVDRMPPKVLLFAGEPILTYIGLQCNIWFLGLTQFHRHNPKNAPQSDQPFFKAHQCVQHKDKCADHGSSVTIGRKRSRTRKLCFCEDRGHAHQILRLQSIGQ